MAKNANIIADSIGDFMNKNRVDVWTLKWDDFYKVTERERVKSAFENQLRDKLFEHGILIAYGKTTIVIARDFNFNPRPFK